MSVQNSWMNKLAGDRRVQWKVRVTVLCYFCTKPIFMFFLLFEFFLEMFVVWKRSKFIHFKLVNCVCLLNFRVLYEITFFFLPKIVWCGSCDCRRNVYQCMLVKERKTKIYQFFLGCVNSYFWISTLFFEKKEREKSARNHDDHWKEKRVWKTREEKKTS